VLASILVNVGHVSGFPVNAAAQVGDAVPPSKHDGVRGDRASPVRNGAVEA
jgi:hypothetical protein